jgi:hypothetical protein
MRPAPRRASKRSGRARSSEPEAAHRTISPFRPPPCAFATRFPRTERSAPPAIRCREPTFRDACVESGDTDRRRRPWAYPHGLSILTRRRQRRSKWPRTRIGQISPGIGARLGGRPRGGNPGRSKAGRCCIPHRAPRPGSSQATCAVNSRRAPSSSLWRRREEAC